MTREEFREALNELELTQVEFARGIGMTDRAVRRWTAGHEKVPRFVAVLIDLMLIYPNIQDRFRLWTVIPLPAATSDIRRGAPRD